MIDTLAEKGLLERTLVVAMGEFGRTPKINVNAGRDHYPRVNWSVFAGGGVQPGQLIGGTDARRRSARRRHRHHARRHRGHDLSRARHRSPHRVSHQHRPTGHAGPARPRHDGSVRVTRLLSCLASHRIGQWEDATRRYHFSCLSDRCLVCADSASGAEHDEFFEREVRPILVERCLSCHGAKKQEGSLRLDSRAAVLKGGEGGPAAIAGQPQASRLVTAIRYGDELQMPPDKQLEDREIAVLTRWVELQLPWPANLPLLAVAA